MTIAFISQDLVQVKPSIVQPTDTETKYKRSPKKEVQDSSCWGLRGVPYPLKKSPKNGGLGS